MEALSHEQAEDHLAEAVLIVRHHLHESNAHRFWPGGADHGCPDLDWFLVGGRFDHKLDKCTLRKGPCGFESAATHGDIRHPIVDPDCIVRE